MPEVILAEDVASEMSKLQSRADKGSSEAFYLLKIINRGIGKLAADAEAGKKIQKRLWPSEYVVKYGISNLWKLNLDSYWRAIYTLKGGQPEIIGFLIDVLNHKEYDRKFGYRS